MKLSKELEKIMIEQVKDAGLYDYYNVENKRVEIPLKDGEVSMFDVSESDMFKICDLLTNKECDEHHFISYITEGCKIDNGGYTLNIELADDYTHRQIEFRDEIRE